MDANSIINSLSGKFPEVVEDAKVDSDIRVSARLKDTEKVVEVCQYLKDELQFDHLSCETAVDYPKKDQIQVVYHIGSYDHPVLLTIKADLPREDPRIGSIVEVYWNANWYEREVHELFGVTFIDHPDPRPLVLPDELMGDWPLRKDYEGFPNTTARNLV
jgi:NADH-quinone oxidoreductase subunit C